MPKMKTRSSAKKRFRLTATGKVKHAPAYKRHNLRKRPQKMKNKSRGMEVVDKTAQHRFKQWLPYGRS